MIDIALAQSIFWNSFKVRLINMALIAEVCRKRAWLLSGDYSSNIQIVTFNHSNSLKTKIFGALPRTPLREIGGLHRSEAYTVHSNLALLVIYFTLFDMRMFSLIPFFGFRN